MLIDAHGKEFTTFAADLRFAANLTRTVAREDYISAAFEGMKAARWVGVAVPDYVTRWVDFGASLAGAKTSEEVSAALDQFALPSGSYVAKRTLETGNTFQVELFVNAYLGLSTGGEQVTNAPAGGGGFLPFAGVSLPIGLEVAFTGKDHSASLFLSVVDLGAVASYRLGAPGTNAAPNVGVAQLIAPGIFCMITPWTDYPIGVGIGYQYAPRLRNLQSGETVDASRIAVLIAVDVPLFRLH